LKQLLEAYERSLILAALAAAGGRQRTAAAFLRVLPATLNVKMKRLGIGRQRVHRAAVPARDQVCASVRWTGLVRPGGTLELRGLNGPVRIEASENDQIDVLARRRGSRTDFHTTEVKIVEHERGVTICAVCQGRDPAHPGRPDCGLARNVANVRVDFVARVPPGVRVVASTVNEDVEVIGLSANIEAGTTNGHVRFMPAPAAADIRARDLLG
jgi:hypothetical protein